MLRRTVFSLPLVIIISCADLSKGSNVIRTRKAYSDKNFRDCIINIYVISIVPQCSLVNCLRKCNEHTDCLSFYFNSEERSCQLHDSVFSNSNGSKVENGWNYYLMKGCPYGWIQHEESCYLFDDVDTKNWPKAKAYCESRGGHLAEITTHEKQDFMASMAMTLNESSIGFWSGGNDMDNEGQWTWSSLGHNLHYTAWFQGEPNGHQNENCMALYKLVNYGWVDCPCDWTLNFICERQAL